MTDWSRQLTTNDIKIGDEIPCVSMPVTLQRLVMEAGSNRDFSLIHHDRKVAQSTGADDAYMNTFFILGLFERMLREWMGVRGRIKKISSVKMKNFNVVGDRISCKGKIVEVQDSGAVMLDIWMENEKGVSVVATADVTLPE